MIHGFPSWFLNKSFRNYFESTLDMQILAQKAISGQIESDYGAYE
jgi:hypothetical protein